MTDTAPDTGTDAPDDIPADAPDTDTTDWKAEAEKHKALARKHEDRAKANAAAAKELDELRKTTMTDLERAVADAAAQTRATVLAEVAADRVADAVRLAAAGTPLDVEALLEGLDKGRFVTEDGQVDKDRIEQYVASITPKVTEPSADPFAGLDLGQGAGRGNDSKDMALNGDPILNAVRDRLGIR